MRKLLKGKMKKVVATGLCLAMVAGCLAGCGSSDDKSSESSTAAEKTEDVGEKTEAPSGEKKGTINVWAFTDEVPKMIDKYVETHPDFGYEINTTIVATTDGAYQPALDQALAAGGPDAPDIYCAEAAFVLKYTQGDASSYAAAYEDLGIDVDSKIAEAQIAQYSVDIGTNPDGKVVGLGYQATGGCFIYRRSIAKDAFGTDDPAEISKIIGGGSGNWDKFFEAAETLKGKGYGIVSGDGDIWHAVENSSDDGWIVDGKLTIDPKREAFLDISKKLKDNDYYNDTQDWQDAWFADMKGVLRESLVSLVLHGSSTTHLHLTAVVQQLVKVHMVTGQYVILQLVSSGVAHGYLLTRIQRRRKLLLKSLSGLHLTQQRMDFSMLGLTELLIGITTLTQLLQRIALLQVRL